MSNAGHKILIVEDNRDIMLALATALRQRGHEVEDADSGEDALTLALNRPFDLAVIDVHLPGMSGTELAQRLNKEARVPFMFISGDDDISVVRRATEQGALGYLVKPLETAQMVPGIETALARAADMRKLARDDDRFNAALAVARQVNLAVGIVMERHCTDRHQAYELLRDRARSQRRKVNDVAMELLSATELCNLTTKSDG